MSEYDWLDGSIQEVDRSIQSFHESFKEFCEKCDKLIEHMSKTDFDKQAIKETVREAQIEALEEILSRFERKGWVLKDSDPDVVKMLEGFSGVIREWRKDEAN